MRNPIFKTRYKGYGIYWHGESTYGDETNGYARSVEECKRLIDEKLAQEEASRPAHEVYWQSLTHEQRSYWRSICWNEQVNPNDLSASELAYTMDGKAIVL